MKDVVLSELGWLTSQISDKLSNNKVIDVSYVARSTNLVAHGISPFAVLKKKHIFWFKKFFILSLKSSLVADRSCSYNLGLIIFDENSHQLFKNYL